MPAVDQLLQAIGRLFAMMKLDAPIVVLGACLNDLAVMSAGTIFVIGPVCKDEYHRVIAQYQIGLLMSPYRFGHYWLFNETGEAASLPRAYFDWTLGATPADSRDLAIDPRICDVKAARALANWWRSAVQPFGAT
jgi:hypothetical protein